MIIDFQQYPFGVLKHTNMEEEEEITMTSEE